MDHHLLTRSWRRPLLLRPPICFLFSKGAYGAPFVQIVISNLNTWRRPADVGLLFTTAIDLSPLIQRHEIVSWPSAPNATYALFSRSLRLPRTTKTVRLVLPLCQRYAQTQLWLQKKRFDSLLIQVSLHQPVTRKTFTDHWPSATIVAFSEICGPNELY